MTVNQTERPRRQSGALVRVAVISLAVGVGFAALTIATERPMPQTWLQFLQDNAPILQILGAVIAGLAVALPLGASATTSRLQALRRRAMALETRPIPMARDHAP